MKFANGSYVKRALLIGALVALGASVGLRSRAPLPSAIHLPPRPRAPAVAVERGHVVYSRYGCAMCHGADGKGGVANPNAETDGKIPGVTRVAEGYTRRELRDLILKGVPRIGKADANAPLPPLRMPGWSDTMTAEEANDLTEYLFSLFPESAQQKWR